MTSTRRVVAGGGSILLLLDSFFHLSIQRQTNKYWRLTHSFFFFPNRFLPSAPAWLEVDGVRQLFSERSASAASSVRSNVFVSAFVCLFGLHVASSISYQRSGTFFECLHRNPPLLRSSASPFFYHFCSLFFFIILIDRFYLDVFCMQILCTYVYLFCI